MVPDFESTFFCLQLSFACKYHAKKGSVQESDGKRDFSGVAFPGKTATVAVVAVLISTANRQFCPFRAIVVVGRC
jgi:hypothetical protein